MENFPLIVGISGASGAIYGIRLLEALHGKIPTHLVVSKTAALTLKKEVGVSVDQIRAFAQTTYQNADVGAAIASGSFRTRGMVIAPCSIRTLSDIAYGTTNTLLSRAADVMRHFYVRAEMGKNAGRKEALVDQDYKDAATLAALVAPFRHARLSAMKLAGDPNNPTRFKDDATAGELRAELMKRIATLQDAGLIDLKALPLPHGGTANQSIPGVDQSRITGE